MPDTEKIKITYTFNFNNQIVKTFDLFIDSASLFIVDDNNYNTPDWARLSSFSCPNCPLDKTSEDFCPLAKHLSTVIQFFQNLPSYQEAVVSVETDERTTSKATSVQIGVGSLIGVIMSCSGCPVVGKLRSLARFHLPFSSLEETEYRIISMYIAAQYVKMQNGQEADWDMKKLENAYREIQKVNKNIVEKLSEVEMNDTSRNAVVTLSSFAEYILSKIEYKDFDQLQTYFSSFTEI